ncbi:hypothetical protein QPK87_11620 [Kamptonema cortianum]|nr:hypothetical protein [Kamptonema cortianum]
MTAVIPWELCHCNKDHFLLEINVLSFSDTPPTMAGTGLFGAMTPVRPQD